VATSTGFSPTSPAVMADPYPFYERLRREEPVARDDHNGFWVLSRYADAVVALRDHVRFSSAEGIGPGKGGRSPQGPLIMRDPPDHTRLRSLVGRAFTPRTIAALEPRIREITDQMIDGVIDQGSFDLIQDLATPLPVIVIAELLGVEPERREDFKRWSDDVVRSIGPTMEMDGSRLQQSFFDLGAYFYQAVEERRRGRRNDLISALVAAHEDQDALTSMEVLNFCTLLLIAGNETTTNLIANAMLALAQHPEQVEALSANPALIPSMVEEALRYDGPVQGIYRTATRDVTFGETTIPAGDKVLVLFASADRDEAQFPNAGCFDITRTPNNHIAFGYGIHFCLGAPLARLEARIAFEHLFRRMTNLRPDPDATPVRMVNPILRGLERYPMVFERT
jgi:cytochrome P450